MKILELAPYALISGHKGFEKNTSGLAVAVKDICVSLSKEGNEVYLITQSAITKKFTYENVNIVQKKWIDILFNIRPKYISNAFKAIRGLDATLVYKLKVIVYFLTQGYVEKIIKKLKPDIVQIHSIGYYTLPFMFACASQKVKFVVTSHGMVTFVPNEDVDSKQRLLERKFCTLADKHNLKVTVISNGVKQRMIKYFNLKNDILKVVLNGTTLKFNYSEDGVERLKKKYDIVDETVFICVGSLSTRKNQIQAVRAFALLQEDIRKKAKLLIVGSGKAEDEIEQYILQYNMQKNVICCGYINHSQIQNFYSIADYNLTLSIDEGFGLPIIEGYQFGVKTIMFDDLDAYSDVYNSNTVITINERSDEKVAEVLEKAITDKPKKELIMEQAGAFSSKMMAQNYMEIFKELIQNDIYIKENELRELL